MVLYRSALNKHHLPSTVLGINSNEIKKGEVKFSFQMYLRKRPQPFVPECSYTFDIPQQTQKELWYNPLQDQKEQQKKKKKKERKLASEQASYKSI